MKNTFIIFLLLLSASSKASSPRPLRFASTFEHRRNKVIYEDMYVSWSLWSSVPKPDVYNIRVSDIFDETIQELTTEDDYIILDKKMFSKMEYGVPFLISVSCKTKKYEMLKVDAAFELIDDKLLKREVTSFQDSLNYLLDYGCFSNLFKLLKDKQADYFIDEIISKYKSRDSLEMLRYRTYSNSATNVFDYKIFQDDDSLRLLKSPKIKKKKR